MARRKRGNPLHGWVVIDKPLGVTSTQVVAKVRWAFRAQKAGHAGTLDPLATGVLAVALGEATKTVPFAQEGLKTYAFTVRLGQRTSTDDAEGEVIASSDARPTDAEIVSALTDFEGDIEQVPPQFSAVKVAGERAYDLAREGETLDLASRPLHVASIRMTARPDADHAEIEMTCGKGGYVRSIARDLGEALGCRGHVSALRRTRAGPFGLEHALEWEALDPIRESGWEDGDLLPVAAGLCGLPEVPVDAIVAAGLRQGRAMEHARARAVDGETGWASHEGEPVAVVEGRYGLLKPVRVFTAAE